MNKHFEDLKESHRRILIQEAQEGKIERDTLPNSAYAFSGSLLAGYAARSRIFMASVLAHMIMENHKDKTPDFYRVTGRG